MPCSLYGWVKFAGAEGCPKTRGMNISFEWIKTWLPLPQEAGSDVQTVADVLTATGLEVEGVQEIQPFQAD